MGKNDGYLMVHVGNTEESLDHLGRRICCGVKHEVSLIAKYLTNGCQNIALKYSSHLLDYTIIIASLPIQPSCIRLSAISPPFIAKIRTCNWVPRGTAQCERNSPLFFLFSKHRFEAWSTEEKVLLKWNTRSV